MASRLNDIAQAYWFTNTDSVLIWAKKAEQLARKIDYPFGIYNSYLVRGVGFDINSQDSLALSYHRKALEYFQKENDSMRTANLYTYIAIIQNDFGNSDSALYYHQEALELYQKLGMKHEAAMAFNNIGTVYTELFDLPTALEYQFKSLKMKEEINDPNMQMGISGNYANIAKVYSQLEDYESAVIYLKKSIEIKEKGDQPLLLATGYQSLGVVYGYLGKHDSAKVYLDKSYRLFQESNYKPGIGIAYSTYAKYYNDIGNSTKAKEYVIKSIEVFEELGYDRNISSSHLMLSRIFYDSGDYRQSIAEAELVLKSRSENEFDEEIYEAYNLLANANEKLGNYQKSLEFLKKHHDIKDSLEAHKSRSEINSLRLQRETLEKDRLENQNQLQKANLDLQKTRLNTQANVIILSLVALVITIIAAVFIYLERKRIKKVNIMLKDQNEQIEMQKNELDKKAKETEKLNEELVELGNFKENLTSMIVHDLKNPLNAILHSDLSVDSRENMQRIQYYSRQMLTLVMNILDVQKFESAQFNLSKQIVNTLEISQKAIEETDFLSQRRNISIQNDIDPRLFINADVELINRVLVNLLSNAIKYSPLNGTIIIASSFDEARREVTISVKDEGKGIPQEYLERIFEKFKQIDPLESGILKSTGLGLTFCKMAIEAHGGEIFAESYPDKGTKLTFTVEGSKDTRDFIANNAADSSMLNAAEFHIPFDKAEIKELIDRLRQFEIYEISKIKQILLEAKNINDEQVRNWTRAVEMAANNFNKDQYEKLLK